MITLGPKQKAGETSVTGRFYILGNPLPCSQIRQGYPSGAKLVKYPNDVPTFVQFSHYARSWGHHMETLEGIDEVTLITSNGEGGEEWHSG